MSAKKENKFVHIHNHSCYSSRDGLARIDEMVEIAKKNKEHFALTDHGSIAGWMNYYNYSKKHGFKPIFGMEAYINKYRDELFEINAELKETKDKDYKVQLNARKNVIKRPNHIVLIAKNITGYYNIIKLNNMGFSHGFYQKPTITPEELFKYSEGVIVSTACLGGSIPRAITEKRFKDAIDEVKLYKEKLGDDFYLEVQVNEMKEQTVVNKGIMKLADKTKTKVLIGVDSHYTNRDDASTHQDLLLMQSSGKRSDIGETDTAVVYENRRGEIKTKKIKDTEGDFLKDIPFESLVVGETFKNNKILEIKATPRVWVFEAQNLWFKDSKILLKEMQESELVDIAEEVFQNHLELDGKIEEFDVNLDNKLPCVENAEDIIAKKCKKALIQLKKDGKLLVDPSVYAKRLKFELEVIQSNGFSSYFLILDDMLEFCYTNEIPIGAGRGSSVSSLCSYLLKITRVDPLDPRWGKDGLPFERFLSTERNSNRFLVQDENGIEHRYYEGDEIETNRGTIKIEDLKENDEVYL